MTGIFVGAFYSHMEGYLTPQTNTDSQWHGVWMLHDVADGEMDIMPVSYRFLEAKYG